MRVYDVKMTRYYPSFWQRIKIRLFGYKILEECRREEVKFDTEEFLDNWKA